jgi:hypothetical protein
MQRNPAPACKAACCLHRTIIMASSQSSSRAPLCGWPAKGVKLLKPTGTSGRTRVDSSDSSPCLQYTLGVRLQ